MNVGIQTCRHAQTLCFAWWPSWRIVRMRTRSLAYLFSSANIVVARTSARFISLT